MIYICITQSMSVLHNRFLYYSVLPDTTLYDSVLHGANFITLNYSAEDKKTSYWFLYKNDRFWFTDFYLAWDRTTRSICLVWLYDMIYICTTQSISVLHNRFLYYTIDICTTQSISVLHTRYLYYTIDICTTHFNRILIKS